MKFGFVKSINKNTGIMNIEGVSELSVVEVPFIADPANMPAFEVGQRVKYFEAVRAVNVQADNEILGTRIR